MTARILPWIRRETQDFASLQGKRLCIISLSKSRDAKSCVSQVGKTNIVNTLFVCVYCNGLDGRRKILRLYKWVRPLLPMPYLYVFVAVCRTGDARFCVSTGLLPLRYRVKKGGLSGKRKSLSGIFPIRYNHPAAGVICLNMIGAAAS